jgi:hypothetical protein
VRRRRRTMGLGKLRNVGGSQSQDPSPGVGSSHITRIPLFKKKTLDAYRVGPSGEIQNGSKTPL